MPRRSRRKPPKRDRAEAARLGGSAVARAAFERPGGTFGRRRQPRRIDRERAIRESAG
jgi:hypothetical protein